MVPCVKRPERGTSTCRLRLMPSAVERASLLEIMAGGDDRSLAIGDPNKGRKKGDGPRCRGLMHLTFSSYVPPGDQGSSGRW
ncbi:hypothetical protein B296_00025206 [Ensete ventricosum]|uniref:Uncharacterized protein n=1 Tax=Ensete ventricosum TaxID=4639 RepID=A0A427AP73_ENSVE|nr:hypothetical protein B296_00025206 [Ensete ventricosum]